MNFYAILCLVLALLCAAIGTGLLLWHRHQKRNPDLSWTWKGHAADHCVRYNMMEIMAMWPQHIDESGSVGGYTTGFMFARNWVTADGQELEPLTIITEDKVRSGEIKPSPQANFTVEYVLRYFKVMTEFTPVYKGENPQADEFSGWPFGEIGHLDEFGHLDEGDLRLDGYKLGMDPQYKFGERGQIVITDGTADVYDPKDVRRVLVDEQNAFAPETDTSEDNVPS